FFFQAEDGIRDFHVTGVQTCALPIFVGAADRAGDGGTAPHERQRGAEGDRRSSTGSCGRSTGTAVIWTGSSSSPTVTSLSSPGTFVTGGSPLTSCRRCCQR